MDFDKKVFQYGIFLGRRSKEKEKLAFLERIIEEFNHLGYESKALKKDLKRFSGINLYVGDVAKADNLIVAHYDTPNNSFSKESKLYPFNDKKTESSVIEFSKKLALYAIIIGLMLMFVVAYYFKVSGLALRVIWISITVLMTLFGYIVLRGLPNPVSANLNTSSIIAMLKIAESKPKNTAFILTDRECIDNLGDVMVNEALPTTINKKTIIHLKAVGRGKNIVIGFKPENKNLAQKFSANSKNVRLFEMKPFNLTNHSLSYYPKGVSISVANRFNNDYEIENVFNDKDLKISENKVNDVVTLILKYLEMY